MSLLSLLILQGVLLLKPGVVAEGSTENGQKIVRLWVHEVYRVFYDRLINEEDREMFYKMVKVCCRKGSVIVGIKLVRFNLVKAF